MPRNHGPGVRLFVALDPPADTRRALGSWVRTQRALRATIRPVPVADLHVTLAFLGSRPPHELDPIARVIARVGASCVCREISTGAPLWLPPRRPRALTVELHDGRGDLASLHGMLADALAGAIGWREDRPLRPHVTVARRRATSPAGSIGLAPTPSLSFDAAALTLYRSTLTPEGARYAAVERVELGDG